MSCMDIVRLGTRYSSPFIVEHDFAGFERERSLGVCGLMS